MNLRSVLFSFIILFLPFSGFSVYTGVVAEMHAIDAIPGTVTWRIYAEFDNPADQCISLFGYDTSPLELTTTTTFHQDAFGGPTSVDINPAFFGSFPDLEFDSWVTVGAENTVGNALSAVGFNFVNFEAGNDLIVNDIVGGVLFQLPGDPMTFPVAGRVLLAQLTTDGDLDLLLNIQWRDPLNVSTEEHGIVLQATSAIPGCTDSNALNYNSNATEDDGSCTYPAPSYSGLSWEEVIVDGVTGYTTYRVYANFSNSFDQLTAVYGQDIAPLSINSTGSFYQDLNGGLTSTDINPALFGAFPDLEYDSWVSIGAESGPNGVQNLGVNGAPFEAGGSLTIDDPIGGAWFVFPDDEPAAFPDGMGRVLVAQVTTDGIVDMTLNLQYRAQDGTNPQHDGEFITFPPAIPGCTYLNASNYDSNATVDDGSCIFECPGCTDSTAFNFNPNANTDDGSCVPVVMGCTDCSAINYDSTANTDDGSCMATVYGCMDTTAFNYDPSANVDNGGCVAVMLGCTDSAANNFVMYANTDDGSCDYTITCEGDLVVDGIIDTADLLVFLSIYGTSCN